MGDRKTLGKEIWRGKCEQQNSGSAGGRWRRYHKRELGGDKWSVGFRFSWRKMETTAQGRAGWRQVVCGLQVQLKEEGHDSTRQSWVETSGLWASGSAEGRWRQ